MDKQKAFEEMRNVLNDLEIDSRDLNEVCDCLINASYGNLKEFAERLLNTIDNEIAHCEKSMAELERREDYETAAKFLHRIDGIEFVKDELKALLKEYGI